MEALGRPEHMKHVNAQMESQRSNQYSSLNACISKANSTTRMHLLRHIGDLGMQTLDVAGSKAWQQTDLATVN